MKPLLFKRKMLVQSFIQGALTAQGARLMGAAGRLRQGGSVGITEGSESTRPAATKAAPVEQIKVDCAILITAIPANPTLSMTNLNARWMGARISPSKKGNATSMEATTFEILDNNVVIVAARRKNPNNWEMDCACCMVIRAVNSKFGLVGLGTC